MAKQTLLISLQQFVRRCPHPLLNSKAYLLTDKNGFDFLIIRPTDVIQTHSSRYVMGFDDQLSFFT